MNFDYLTYARYEKIKNLYKDRCGKALEESFSPNQIESKLWLVDELEHIAQGYTPFEHVEIVGSWFGFPFIDMLDKNEYCTSLNYRLYDIDPLACVVARSYSRIFGISDSVKIYDTDYWTHEVNRPKIDVVFNTSSEHMLETFNQDKYLSGPYHDTKFVIQSNDMYHIDDHVNCCDNVEELIQKNGITNVLYSGTQIINDMSDSIYQRFMVIGKR